MVEGEFHSIRCLFGSWLSCPAPPAFAFGQQSVFALGTMHVLECDITSMRVSNHTTSNSQEHLLHCDHGMVIISGLLHVEHQLRSKNIAKSLQLRDRKANSQVCFCHLCGLLESWPP